MLSAMKFATTAAIVEEHPFTECSSVSCVFQKKFPSSVFYDGVFRVLAAMQTGDDYLEVCICLQRM
jgi:hypothetical protein